MRRNSPSLRDTPGRDRPNDLSFGLKYAGGGRSTFYPLLSGEQVRAVIQRVSQAEVVVQGEVVGVVGRGLLILLGVGRQDGEQDARYLADKAAGLRIFEDEAGKMNLSVEELGGAVLVVSQFTLYGDCRKGRRPSFMEAASPEKAEQLYLAFVDGLRARGLKVATGAFGAKMQVILTNDGPVTLLLETDRVSTSPPDAEA